MSLDTDIFKEAISNHMSEQPYSVICLDCGGKLDWVAKVDFDFDMFIEIAPCSNCQGYE
jgi:hypothetical protein